MKSSLKEHKNAIDKKTGKLKPKYKDMPRYKAIFGYEEDFTNGFESNMKAMTKDIAKQITIFAGLIKNK